tara:strand:+ start:2666 stop:3403 length:738 start_codon:yes stop_codon:yes gene_type:complete
LPEPKRYKETLNTAIEGYVRSGQLSTRTNFPGKVTDFDPVKQTASVQPQIKATLGSGDTVSLPVLIDVPVLFPRAGGFSMTFPVEIGDEVWISCSDRDFSSWLQLGGMQKPDSKKLHSLDSAVAHLGLYNQTNVIETFNDTDMVLRSDDNTTKITISNGSVVIDAPTSCTVNTGVATVNATTAAMNITTSMSVACPATVWTGNISVVGSLTAASVVSLGSLLWDATQSVDAHTHNGGSVGAPDTQ